ncbi:succinyl-CoA synthetase (ADP-forming) beta subunit [Chryseobacterium sp. StRB126]|uniref:hypothetical protein n=1 Tax=Chryseobacterium sp. StRB126 TaxID=878220 RepID=UPI0004E99449|nr:hypothetical protein [Chryseobacterium sp. StRB126]BAP30070.1 succinyl-CoA synthetase (ADP-forming) beta subunit [Chryseobacterium sp. StRB126]
MNTKNFLYIIFVLTIFNSCKTKNQCEVYINTLNRVLEKEYNENLNKNRELFVKENVIINHLSDYTKFNTCERKEILFNSPKDTVIVLERIRHDDYAGTNTNLTGIYRNNELLSFNAFNKGFKTIKIDRDYILSNNHYNYVLKLKQGKFPSKKMSDYPDCALKDITFITLIVNQKIKNIYRICSGEFVKLEEE